jgi:hypothetical protein
VLETEPRHVVPDPCAINWSVSLQLGGKAQLQLLSESADEHEAETRKRTHRKEQRLNPPTDNKGIASYCQYFLRKE